MDHKNSIFIMLTFFISMALSTISYSADDTAQLKQKVEELQEQVTQLQKQMADKSGKNASGVYTPSYDSSYDLDELREMEWMQRQMNHMMRGIAMPRMNLFQAKVDMNQSDTQYVITIDLPGMHKDKIDVAVKDGILMVSGERTSESKENKGNQYYRQERSFGHFMQNIPLPDDAKADTIDAQYNNGVLKVIIPREKKKEKKPEIKKILVK